MNEIEAVGKEALLEPLANEGTAGHDRPWLFSLLIAPSAVLMNGVVQGGVIAYLMTQQQVSIGRAAAIVSAVSLPSFLYWLWGPITDFLVQRRIWVLLGAVAAGGLMMAAFRQPSLDTKTAVALMFLAACCSQLVVASCGGMMGTLHSVRARRVAGSFYQSGSAGFGAASVFVLIMVGGHGQQAIPLLSHEGLSHKLLNLLYGLINAMSAGLAHVAVVVGGWHRLLLLLVALLVAGPGLFALLAPRETAGSGESFGSVMRRLGLEFKATFWRWTAIPYALLMLFPMNSGAATGLLPGIAEHYGVSGAQVAWMNGLGGAALLAAGSLAATLIPARVRASIAYLVVGLVNAATLLVLWLGPMRPGVYFAGATLYLFINGMALATFTAVVLEFMGKSGKSGSGRYSIINSLGNVPVVYMIALDGWGGNKWGPRGLAATEAVMGAAGALILLAYFLVHKSHGTPQKSAAA